MKEEKLWSKDFIVATFVNFLLVLNYYLLMVVIADYSLSEFNVSESMAGLAASMFVIGALAARFFAAKLMDIFGQKRLLIICSIFVLALSSLYLFAVNICILYGIRFLHGMTYGVASTAITTFITKTIPQKRYGAGIGYFMLSVTLGTAIGPFVGMFLTNIYGYFGIFISCIVIAGIGLFGSMIVKSQNYENIEDTEIVTKRESKAFFEIKVFPICAICAGVYFSYSGIVSFLSSYSNEINLQFAATFFFIVYSVVIILSRPFTGKLFDTKGERIAMLPAFMSFLIGMLLLSFAENDIMLLFAAAFSGYGVGVIQSCGLAIAVRGISKERLGYVNSTYYIFIDTGMGIGPVLLGLFVPFFGYGGMYLMIAGLIVVLGCAYVIVSRKKVVEAN